MKATKLKWFIASQHGNRISHRRLTSFEERNQHLFNLSRAAFPTWPEAHAWLLSERIAGVEKAKKALASAERSLAKARLIKPKERT